MSNDIQDMHEEGDGFTLDDVKNGVCTQKEYEDGLVLSGEESSEQ